ncbi:microfibril-associated glycoprotein 4 [Hyalella azteca]|uniref:Microfibril-associated glycoprotein 4 n=1 Tax=Hyalella azteca TaxID=294128 RepID=A0A8B7NWI5_HYAAZ|nr:microfibril-associated glycoprotein 4 [Hyalella azteca]
MDKHVDHLQIDFADPQPSRKDKNGEHKVTGGRKSVQLSAVQCRKQCNFLHCFEIVCIIILTTCVVLLYLDSKKLMSPAEESAEIGPLTSELPLTSDPPLTSESTIISQSSTIKPHQKKVPLTPTDCSERPEKASGVYIIYPSGVDTIYPTAVQVYCDQTTDGGGWTVFLRRQKQEPQLNFSRTLGMLGTQGMLGVEGGKNYTLRVGGFDNVSSSAYDALTYHDGMQFSTIDRDRDLKHGGSCSRGLGGGGWWYNDCYKANPTGVYGGDSPAEKTTGEFLVWRVVYQKHVTQLTLMIRPKD